jgi:probable rRNA maturation factor
MEIAVANNQRRVRFDLAWLRRAAESALGPCAASPGDGRFALRALEFVEVAVVSDEAIARVHVRFMGVPGATDVITFDHGEIVVSAATAQRAAREHGHCVEHELALYVIHGLLHLNGHDDRASTARRRMFRVQERIWRRVLRDAAR